MSERNNIPLRQAQGTKHWQVKKLGEIFTIERGGSPRPIEDYITNDENGINWIKIGDTKDVVKYIYQTKEKIKPEGAKRSRMVYKDDFILSNSMSFGRPYIMKTQGCIHDGWLVIRKNKIIDSNYLYLILSSSQVYQQFTNLAKGSTVKNLNIQAVKEVVISFPPLSEQLAIVSKIEELLSDLENGKQQLLTAQQQLKVYRQSLLKAAFTSTTLSDRNTIFKDYILKDVTQKIQIGPFGTQLHKEDYIENGVPLINPMHILDGKIEANFSYSIKEEKRNSLPNYILEEGDVIMGRRGEMGRCGFVTNKEKGWFCGTGSLYFRPLKEKLNSRFLFYYLTSQPIKKYLNDNAGGTTMANLNLKIVNEIPISLPSLKEQQQIVEILESKLTVCDKIEESISQSLLQAEALKQSILKKAFEGKLV